MEVTFDINFKIPIGRQAEAAEQQLDENGREENGCNLTVPVEALPEQISTVEEFVRPCCVINNGQRKRVAVIGAGVSGLCTLKHLIGSESFVPKVFDRNSKIGGGWIYTEDEDLDQHGLPVHSCLYKSLRSNNPKPLMTLPGFPFNPNGNSYIGHEEVLRYIEDFSAYYDLEKHIQFNTLVTDVSPKMQADDKVLWKVTYKNVSKQTKLVTEEFDAVCICNGHYSEPYIPEVKGIEKFKGKVLHSRCYRKPESYSGKNVLILGASFSGQDISCDISPVANKVFLSHRHRLGKLPTELHPNITEKPNVDHVNEDSVVFEDGTEEQIDCFLFCTGFLYSFPFLSDDIIKVENKRITPLYLHMVHVKYTSLVFVGVPTTWSYFPQIHEQSRAAVAILKGNIKLPTVDEMMEDMEKDYQDRLKMGLNELETHFFGVGYIQWDYNKMLADLCGFEPLPPVLYDIAVVVAYRRRFEFLDFRKQNFKLISSDEFETD